MYKRLKQFNYIWLLALFWLCFSCAEVEATWYNGDWAYRMKVTVDSAKVTGDLVNFPVMLDLSDFGNDFWTNVKSTGADIVMTDNGGSTKLKRELETIHTTSNQGILWFKAASLSSTVNSDFYLYYG
ncbi:MAG: hypothetical protein O3C63_06110, partial [Cyanobacteria bacterium]|nr:hypothetical protein [Cyanobacteriota bacterium]MDA1020921.1 hypothetical protein [Cyanobacteriota bacterium]